MKSGISLHSVDKQPLNFSAVPSKFFEWNSLFEKSIDLCMNLSKDMKLTARLKCVFCEVVIKDN